jgi:hypothetical protein
MKKFFVSIVMVMCMAAVPVFAWEPSDLMDYPEGMDAGDFILNIGAGFDTPEYSWDDYTYILPIQVSLDYNLALGDDTLPFFVGGVGGYSGYG